jgi:hypothetical protein
MQTNRRYFIQPTNEHELEKFLHEVSDGLNDERNQLAYRFRTFPHE